MRSESREATFVGCCRVGHFFCLFLLQLLLFATVGEASGEVVVADSESSSISVEFVFEVGTPVQAVLDDLVARGLRLSYSEALVSADLKVMTRLAGNAPEEILPELLAPHGLAARSGPRGRLLVVRSEAGAGRVEALAEIGSLEGTVRGADGEPVAGAEISARQRRKGRKGSETVVRGKSREDGTFRLEGFAGGEWSIEVLAPLYRAVRQTVRILPGQVVVANFELEELPQSSEAIEVTSGYSLFGSRSTAGSVLGSREVREVPHFGEELMKIVQALPGVTTNDFSARFNLRGGYFNEMLVVHDGIELFEPFHMKFISGGFLSIVDPETVDEITLLPGGFGAQFGDRMTGVLELKTKPVTQSTQRLGASITNINAAAAGLLLDGRGSYQVSGRQGFLEIAIAITGGGDDNVTARYWDGFGVLSLDPTPSQTVRIQGLIGKDDFLIDDSETISPGVRTSDKLDVTYGNQTYAIRHLGIVGKRSLVETTVSMGKVDQNRTGISQDPNTENGILHDIRDLSVLTLRQSWEHELPGLGLSWGLESRQFSAEYDYGSEVELFDDFSFLVDDPRLLPRMRLNSYDGKPESDSTAGWVSGQLRHGNWVLQPGLRYDRQSHLSETQWSPRLNVSAELGRIGSFRAGWGQFYQSQRVHELDVQDGEFSFFPAEQAEHFTLGYERALGRGVKFRAEAYRRLVKNPRPRFENLFDPFSFALELEFDRYRVAPDRSLAQGVEVFVGSSRGAKWSWWIAADSSSAVDEIDGRDVRRSIDQPFGLKVSATYRPGSKWTFGFLQFFHTGWPETEISYGDRIPGTRMLQLELGPTNSGRVSKYHRLDIRFSRFHKLAPGRGQLRYFLDIQNVYDRENQWGTDSENGRFVETPQGDLRFEPLRESGLFGIIPSFGVLWTR